MGTCTAPGTCPERPVSSVAPDGQNRVRGRVVRQAYLGDQQDLRIALAGDLEIRAFVPSHETYRAGEEILVELPVDACRLVRP